MVLGEQNEDQNIGSQGNLAPETSGPLANFKRASEKSLAEFGLVKKTFDDAFESVSLVIAPGEAIKAAEFQSGAPTGVHILKPLNHADNLILTCSQLRVALYFAQRGADYETAKQYGEKIVSPGNITIAAEQIAPRQRDVGVYHEIIHRFLEKLQSNPSDIERNAGNEFRDAYFNIPFRFREPFEDLLLGAGYPQENLPGEFWAYYLALATFPKESSEKEVVADICEAILALGEYSTVAGLTRKFPFLKNTAKIHENIDKLIEKAEHIKL